MKGDQDHTVNYPELGQVHENHVFYPEGAVWTHPSGSVYKVIKREGLFRWKLIRLPDGTRVE
jgi:hypothetical protein